MEKLQKCPFQQGTIPNQRVVTDNGSHESILFPLVLLPPASNEGKMSLPCFPNTIRNNREWIDNQLKEVGALLFRGFPLKTASDFNEVVEALGWEEHTYMGAAARKRVHGRVFTASEAALHLPIHFHHEMSKFEDFPAKLLFFCEIAPPEGGQSAIVLSHKITQRMEQEFPELVAKLAKEGLLYSSVHPEKEEDDPTFLLKSWKTLFRTEDKEEAERFAERDFNWKVTWEGSRMILKMGPLTSIRTFDGNESKKAWFNLLAFGSTHSNIVILGDGSEIPPEAIEKCKQIAEEECVDIDWQVGDVVVIDNRYVQHSRRPSKPPRTILAAFCK
ncbi:hypothetical protein SUGI_0989100 [Cryptomeria japonica]|uniref:clavaminate synthase-like protein At3g21360 n=1 Tax=Cryptomeria japonica TaxID=3369 RepID=UPI002414C21D|nr:clavaminate synthase-like protein At3g21360 [Cryptomeria japonica]GLJ46894.1 hypothetical protein SUGI_0989100 [Cryptomeria japonica]